MTHTPPSKPFPGRGRAFPLLSAPFSPVHQPKSPCHATETCLAESPPHRFRINWAWSRDLNVQHETPFLPSTQFTSPKGGLQSGWKIDSLEHLGPAGFFSRPAVDADKSSAVGFSLFVLNRRFVLSPFLQKICQSVCVEVFCSVRAEFNFLILKMNLISLNQLFFCRT